MSTYTSTVQRRKSSKNKTSNNNNKQVSSTTASFQDATTSAISSSSSTADNATALLALAAAAAASQNDRLQRAGLGNRLDAIYAAAARLRGSSTPPPYGNFTTNSVCNGGLVNCCLDVNCRLNAPKSTIADAAAAAATSTSTLAVREREFVRASSCISQNSNASSHYERNSLHGSSSTKTSLPTTSSTRDGSPDSGVSSDGGLLTRATAPLLREGLFTFQISVDLFSWLLFVLAFVTRFYKLTAPANVVFDEMHYGKFITHYMRNQFFFDQHPPLGKQLIASVAIFAGSRSNFSFPHIGAKYDPSVPVFWMRFVPALCGSLLSPCIYKLLLQAKLNRWIALLGGLLVVFDNALLTQSRFILMESMLLLFSSLGMYLLLKFQSSAFGSMHWLLCGLGAAVFFTFATSVKYIGFLSGCLCGYLLCRYLWDLLYDGKVSNSQLMWQTISRVLIFVLLPLALYLGIFFVHLKILYKAGPHDSAMTSAFQASLEGGLASITKGQPLQVVHGSQITLRHTHGRTCWLHSHAHVYPVRYPDKRGSSHQQQVTCYSFKDVNNWWIVKRPEKDDLLVDTEKDVIRHGDIIQLVHGITSRALNSHDVAAPMTPQCQEVTCYIDYEIDMAGELLWKVEILNKDTEGPIWHAIKSQVRLIHVDTKAALRFSGRQLPDWGFNQHEVVADRTINTRDAIWNVEEHRYTKTRNQKERERQLLSEEMIPTRKTQLTFWEKFMELQSKMFWVSRQVQNHMYSSEPLEWPLLDKPIAYWISSKSNAQIHLLGNIIIWYSCTIAVGIYIALGLFYMVRRRRLCFDLPPSEWERFLEARDLFFVGYLIHFLPYFFVDQTLFLHNYLPAFLYKLLLLCFVIEHLDFLCRHHCGSHLWMVRLYRLAIVAWLILVIGVFIKLLPLCYGRDMTVQDLLDIRFRDTWDFIVRKEVLIQQKK